MNVVVADQRPLNLSGMSLKEVHELQKGFKSGAISSIIDPITKLPVSVTVPSTRSGGKVIVPAYASFYPGAPVKYLQDEYLFDPERNVEAWVGQDDATKKRFDENGDPLEFISIGQNFNGKRGPGESRTHINGNQILREGKYRELVDEYEMQPLVENCTVVPEHRIPIPHRDGKIRIIDNALVTDEGDVRLAIELQCCVLTQDHFHARISDYKAANISQVWVLAAEAADSPAMSNVLMQHGTPFCRWITQ